MERRRRVGKGGEDGGECYGAVAFGFETVWRGSRRDVVRGGRNEWFVSREMLR